MECESRFSSILIVVEFLLMNIDYYQESHLLVLFLGVLVEELIFDVVFYINVNEEQGYFNSTLQ